MGLQALDIAKEQADALLLLVEIWDKKIEKRCALRTHLLVGQPGEAVSTQQKFSAS